MALVLVAALAGFVVQEWRASHPIVNLALFRIRMFTASVVSLLVLGTANSVLGFLLPFYMQGVLGLHRPSWASSSWGRPWPPSCAPP